MTKVSIIAPGNMGAAIGGRLVANGVEVRTLLDGRSAATVARAEAAGMVGVTPEAIADVDFVLSVVPPQEVLATARSLAGPLAAAVRKPVYVECNAINPATTQAVGAVITDTGAAYVDGSIIGMPPREGYAGPALFVSGPDAARVDALSTYGMDIRVMDGPVGAASAIKMAYGGITKGLIAVGSAMILGAVDNDVGGDLKAELAKSQPRLLEGFSRSIPDMFEKAYRWVAEMEEIAGFLPEGSPHADMYRSVAAFYEWLAAEEGREGIAALAEFFAVEGERS